MIHGKYMSALTELRALAGEVPADVWERIRPVVAQLSGLEPLVKNLETATVIVVAPVPEKRLALQ